MITADQFLLYRNAETGSYWLQDNDAIRAGKPLTQVYYGPFETEQAAIDRAVQVAQWVKLADKAMRLARERYQADHAAWEAARDAVEARNAALDAERQAKLDATESLRAAVRALEETEVAK